MARFANLTKGTRARKSVMLPLGSSVADPVDGGFTNGAVPVHVRKLTGGEMLDAEEAARTASKARGVADPIEGDAIYDYARKVEIILRAFVDSDSPESAPAAFFANAKEITESEDLSQDHDAYLYEVWESWEDECSPIRRNMSAGEAVAAVHTLARSSVSEATYAFLALAPVMRASLLHTTASLYIDSLKGRSPSSSPSGNTPN